jgi:hypothetical protein
MGFANGDHHSAYSLYKKEGGVNKILLQANSRSLGELRALSRIQPILSFIHQSRSQIHHTFTFGTGSETTVGAFQASYPLSR